MYYLCKFLYWLLNPKQLFCKHQWMYGEYPITYGVFYGLKYIDCSKCRLHEDVGVNERLKRNGLL